MESSTAGYEEIRNIKSNKWPILKGCAEKDKTTAAKSNYLKKRIMNVIPKTGWEVSALGYGSGGSRVYNDDWSGEMQRACRFGTNILQLTITENFLDEKNCGNAAGFIPVHGMLHGLLTADEISRSSMIITSKIYTHQRSGRAYSPQEIQKMIDIAISQLGVETLDMISVEIPPFITDSQLAMALYQIKSEINNRRVRYLTIGSTFALTMGGNRPSLSRDVQRPEDIDVSQFSYSFMKILRMMKDVGLLEKLVGVEMPLNLTECECAVKPVGNRWDSELSEFLVEKKERNDSLLDIVRKCDLAVFGDRCFEGYHKNRPIRLLNLKDIDKTNMLTVLKESFEICRYLEDIYKRDIRSGIRDLPSDHPPLPDPASFQYGYVLPTVMIQAGNLLVWEELRHTVIEPNIRNNINILAGINETVKKWCFSYRLASSNMLNCISDAFKTKEIDYVHQIDEVINRVIPEYNDPTLDFADKMLDAALSLGATTVFTDMIHIHAKDLNRPRLSRDVAKQRFSKLMIPEDTTHLVTMQDYEFTRKDNDLKALTEKMMYVSNCESGENPKQ